ncbi:HNH endonuclease [Streptomyces sp. NPDC001774]
MENHHITPLHATGPRDIQLDGLALLCPNCHRTCHRNHAGQAWRAPAAVRAGMLLASAHAPSPAPQS